MSEQPIHTVMHRILGHQREGGTWAPTAHHRGRASSWMAVGLACAGFVAIGVSMVAWPSGMLLAAGLVLIVAGGVVGALSDIFTDVVLDTPRAESEEPHSTPLHRIKATPGEVERQR
ncbi:hypothetical protein RIF23_08960 [Lipingzhangella sp. LS1_29]|uniref:Uncharacterized protein n=1 Tax=Lipingzhangella rawalii TaxID=2055835 RepID=A0ABU2H556_9ACTN|nr:hypothetical protein [Lipingzhangella rawalii]MDS1270423.1 hypothetical protein [Lipingzhangella rawalii]